MFIKKEALLALCAVVMIYGHSRAKSQESHAYKAEVGIVFDDPAHSAFFNYQRYLVRHGKDGYAHRAWEALSSHERTQKITEGEELLTKLHAEILAKSPLSPDEEDILETVWGKNIPPQSTSNAAIAARMDKVMQNFEKSVAAQTQKVTSSGNWGQFFDGSQGNSHDANVAYVTGGNSGHAAYTSSPLTRSQARPTPTSWTQVLPPTKQNGSDPFKTTLPIAVGALAVAGTAGGFLLMQRGAAKTARLQTGYSPVHVQVAALHKMAEDPRLMYDFLRDPSAYAKTNKTSFDPAVAEMVRSALSRHEQGISRLVEANKYRPTDSRIYVAGSTAEAVSNLVATTAAVVGACAAVAVVVAA